MRLSEPKLEAARNFANKVWNASRFVLSSLADKTVLEGWYDNSQLTHREDRWIVSRLDRTIAEVNRSLENFELGEAQQRLYDFIWSDFCDWYIEMAKIRLRSGSAPSPLPTLAHVLERTLRLLHPFMPFITEEVWQNLLARLPRQDGLPESIMIAPYPTADSPRQDSRAEEEIALVMQAVRAVRNTRAQLHIPGQPVPAGHRGSRRSTEHHPGGSRSHTRPYPGWSRCMWSPAAPRPWARPRALPW